MGSLEQVEPVQPIEHWTNLSKRAELSGNYLEGCDAALLGLEQHPQSPELQYRAILNLSRAGAHRRARQLWLQYRMQSDPDKLPGGGALAVDIATLGARLDREEAYAAPLSRRKETLQKAAQHYDSIFARTTNAFPGINAAVLYELSGNSARASKIAAHILRQCASANPQSVEDVYQLEADCAAASLLLNDLDGARKAVERAAAKAVSAAAVASTRKQLMQICDHAGIDDAIISALTNRAVIHYTGHMIAPQGAKGRFPAEAEAEVAGRIQAELAMHNIGYGYGSLACGADILIVEALLERDAEVDVVLPFETTSFLKESVANGGEEWLQRFERCLKRVRFVFATNSEYIGDPKVFAYASQLAMGSATLGGGLGVAKVLQLAVWDGQKTNESAGTFADIQAWQAHGQKTITINSKSNLPARFRKPVDQSTSPQHSPPRKVRAIMFGDFQGFGVLNDLQMLAFNRQVMTSVASALVPHEADIITKNTWGDGLFFVFGDLVSAARCALDIQSALSKLDLVSLGLPKSLGLRLGLDAGAIFEVRDPILDVVSFTGAHISRTARLEPSTPPGEVYVTEAFASLFSLREHGDLDCEYVGTIRAAKGYGRLRTYLLRRSASAEVID